MTLKNLYFFIGNLMILCSSNFSQNQKLPYQSLEDNCDRRVMGHSTKVWKGIPIQNDFNIKINNVPELTILVWNGKWKIWIAWWYHKQAVCGWEIQSGTFIQGRIISSNHYFFMYLTNQVELNTELVCHVGVVSGEKVPVITDRNPHLENLLDSKRCIYLPYSEDSNMVVDLPNMSGMFFTTQRITGADVFVCYDRKLSSNDNYCTILDILLFLWTNNHLNITSRTLHKFWVIVINSVYW